MLDLRDTSTFTEFLVICSGTSEPQLKAIANEIQDEVKKQYAITPYAVDGQPVSQWLILAYHNVVIHVLHEQKREFYRLEDLWVNAPRLKLL